MTFSTYFALVGVAVILAVTPGPDTMLSLRYALSSRRAGLDAATGSSLAAFIWAALAATGLAALFETSPLAYEVLSLVGGCYLIFLGSRALFTARTRMRAAVPAAKTSERRSVLVGAGSAAPLPDSPASPLAGEHAAARAASEVMGPRARTGLLAGMGTCMTNPKVGLFFLALFPQFTPQDSSLAFTVGVLGGTVALTMWLYLVGVVLLVDAANRWLSNPRVTGWIELVSGLTLLGLGVFMLASGATGVLA
ncbi:LysE family translocator [Nesterenkonia flava]|uniref:LysE family translocator n=1 Tax=Nesterenkonia flava TaxID=469799 RepID=A0ABU1FS76_9MICC|nr:LysE family translocator [Nesterenkonia flava]MDR5711484.1 LysE family translocator [Nesterenkonia flava]